VKRSLLVLLVVALASSGASARDQATSAPPAAKPSRDSLTLVRARGKLLACVAPQAPWAIHGPDGALSGFSIDVATRLAQDLGVEAVFVPTDFASLVQAVAEGGARGPPRRPGVPGLPQRLGGRPPLRRLARRLRLGVVRKTRLGRGRAEALSAGRYLRSRVVRARVCAPSWARGRPAPLPLRRRSR